MLKASFTWVIARSVSASFCLRLRCFPSGHTNCQQTRDHALPPSPGWLQRRPPLRFLPSPYATCKRKYDKSLLCLIPNNGWSPVFRAPHSAAPPNWRLQVCITCPQEPFASDTPAPHSRNAAPTSRAPRLPTASPAAGAAHTAGLIRVDLGGRVPVPPLRAGTPGTAALLRQ